MFIFCGVYLIGRFKVGNIKDGILVRIWFFVIWVC